jgi:hypothetical protein
MNRQFRTLPIPIVYANNDELVHTADHPVCNDSTCPCHTEPGALTRRYHESGPRAIVEITPTAQLPSRPSPVRLPAPIVIDVVELPAPRKKRWWQRIKQWLSANYS